jgi:hypothetical protein
MSEDDFDRLLRETIIDAMTRILGAPAVKTVFSYIQRTHLLREEDLPSNVTVFTKGLEDFFKVGAQMIEQEIVKELSAKVSAGFKPSGDFNESIVRLREEYRSRKET